jgi:hypothetical protein
MTIDSDDRDEFTKQTHVVLIGGTDRFMSGWGHAEGRMSYAFWACRPEHDWRVERWVRSRGDMMRVRRVSDDYRGSGLAHVHVYVVGVGHPSLR